MNLTNTQKHIIDLEKKYMELLTEIFQSDEFKHSMHIIEQRIIDDYFELQNIWQIKNKVAIALERITRFFIYKNQSSINVYHSPISSDIAFYTEDALICLDTKTIDLDGNAGDEKWIQFERNQVNIKNKVKYSTDKYKGVHYHECLPTIDKHTNKPLLTFFLCLIYKDDSKSFSIKRMSLACVPNGELSALYDYDLISNYKTYQYITKTHAKSFNKKGIYGLEPYKDINEDWICLENGSYYDTSVKHPSYEDEYVVRRLIGNEYRVLLGGDTARIDPKKIAKRIDSSGNHWNGYIKWNL